MGKSSFIHNHLFVNFCFVHRFSRCVSLLFLFTFMKCRVFPVPICILILVSILVAFWSLFGLHFGTTLIQFSDTFLGIDLCMHSMLIYVDFGSILAPLRVHLGPLGPVLVLFLYLLVQFWTPLAPFQIPVAPF